MGTLKNVRESVSQSVYMPDAELTVYAAALVAAHAIHLSSHAPRILLSSGKGGFGKTQALRYAELFTPNPWYIDGRSDTSYSIQSHLMRPETPTAILDEASQVFGKAGRSGRTSRLYTVGTSGYDSDATVSVSVAGVDEDASAYCMMFIGGLGTALPEDMLTRTIVLPMSKRPKHVVLMPAKTRKGEIEWLRDAVSAWVARNADQISESLSRMPAIHSELCDRLGEIWGPLVAVAAVDSPEELTRILGAFSQIALGKPQDTRTMEERILAAALEIADTTGEDIVFSRDLIAELREWPQWAGFTPRETAMKLSRMIGKTKQVWDGKHTVQGKGWQRDQLTSMLAMYVPSDPVVFPPDEYDEMLAGPMPAFQAEGTSV